MQATQLPANGFPALGYLAGKKHNLIAWPSKFDCFWVKEAGHDASLATDDLYGLSEAIYQIACS